MIYPISEIFYSLQGEGRYAGNPSTFIRFWGCNLVCSWCDSKYSWKDQSFKKIMNEEEIYNEIKKFPTNHFIFTGGEPALFQKQIQSIKEMFPSSFFEIETNGSIKLDSFLFDHINVSYKLKSSGNKSYDLQILPEEVMKTETTVNYKFVCGGQEDLEEILDLQKKYDIDEKMIYIMPLGTTIESQTNSENSKLCIETCLKYGFQFCPRIHILLFGNKMGV